MESFAVGAFTRGVCLDIRTQAFAARRVREPVSPNRALCAFLKQRIAVMTCLAVCFIHIHVDTTITEFALEAVFALASKDRITGSMPGANLSVYATRRLTAWTIITILTRAWSYF
tara:strand:+ start:184 stop:528 length:345 start_codon:yes stop_codon:yes gene_type:complete